MIRLQENINFVVVYTNNIKSKTTNEIVKGE